MNTPTVLVVDDDLDLLQLMTIRLEANGFAVVAVASAEDALTRIAMSRPQAVLTDLQMPGMDGMALFQAIHARDATLPVILLTAHGSIPDAVAATQRGVFGYLSKPYDPPALIELLQRATRLGRVGHPPGQADHDWRAEIITASATMEALLAEAQLAAGCDASVLIQGESGTGKEVLARALHRASPRREQPFVAINCGAMPAELLESELFGHVRGAFTGAAREHPGLFLSAHNGTVFLDEIGDMPPPLQVKLLRVLQEGEVRAVGATTTTPIDVRIVSATHRDLDAAILSGAFREDLYYRLNVVNLHLPPLRERRDDIALLAQHLLQKLNDKYPGGMRRFAPDALELLIAADWPGNVRQLNNVIEQCCALSTTPTIPATLVTRALRDKPADLPTLADARAQFEREYLITLLRRTRGQVSEAARLAGRNRTELYRLLNRYGLSPAMFKPQIDGIATESAQ
jgi:two-component system response regulator GlrR